MAPMLYLHLMVSRADIFVATFY